MTTESGTYTYSKPQVGDRVFIQKEWMTVDRVYPYLLTAKNSKQENVTTPWPGLQFERGKQ